MPCLITAESAAAHIVRGLSGKRFEISFPRRFALMMKLLRLLPDVLFFRITRRLVRPASRTDER